jgi:5-oxoprolinase (ATP-hydrolysing)
MTPGSTRGWRFLVDRGGTFTDVIGVSPDGRVVVRKALSSDASGGDATVAAILALAGSPQAVESVAMGTTVATNALLQAAARRSRC